MSSDTVLIFDTTLRDGEQSPGAALSVSEKVEIAQQLAKLNVDIIEAGFPVSSPAQFKATQLCAEKVHGPVICALARANPEDIAVAAEAIQPAPKRRIHTFIATSPIHMEYKLHKRPDEVLRMAVEAVRHARSFTEDVEFSPEDAGRSEISFLVEILAAVLEAGATTLNIPDTVGYMAAHEYGRLIRQLREQVPNSERAIFSTHCHNDLGLATANSLAGVCNGARQVECTINGLGERAGNAALEEVVMTIHTRPDLFDGVRTNVKTTEIHRTSQLVSQLTGIFVQPNKAIVGANAFAHEAGIHVDGVHKQRQTYEIITPETVGLSGSRIVLGRHSGRAGLADHCKKLGYHLSREDLDLVYKKFIEIADKKKEVFDEDIAAIIADKLRAVEQVYKMEYLHVSSGTGTLPTASVKIRFKNEVKAAAAWGDGPVDAAFGAIRQATGLAPHIENYSIRAVTEGKDAMGEATVFVRSGERTCTGRGVSTDIIEASAEAYVNAINRMIALERQQQAE